MKNIALIATVMLMGIGCAFAGNAPLTAPGDEEVPRDDWREHLHKIEVPQLINRGLDSLQQKTDSIKMLYDVKDVVVINEDNALRVIATADSVQHEYKLTGYIPRQSKYDWIIDLPFVKQEVRKISIIGLKDISFGLLFPSVSDANAKMGYEFGIYNIIGVRWRPAKWMSMTIGSGLSASYIKIKKGYHFEREQGKVYVVPNDERDDMHSKLFTSRIVFPIVWHVYPHKGLQMQLGVIPSLNYLAKITTDYKSEGLKYSESLRSLPVRTFTVDFMAGVGLEKGLSLYFKYSPMNFFRPHCGPDLRFFSVGLSLSL